MHMYIYIICIYTIQNNNVLQHVMLGSHNFFVLYLCVAIL